MKALVLFAILLIASYSSAVLAQTWTSLQGPQVVSNVRDISISSSGENLYLAEQGYVVKSTNSGDGWKPSEILYSSPSIVLVKPNDNSKVVVAKNGELAYSADGGDANSWDQKITGNFFVPLRLVAAVNDASKMLFGKQYHAQSTTVIYTSANGGANWTGITEFTSQTHISDFAPYPNSTDSHAVGIVWAGGVDPDGLPDGTSNSSPAGASGLWWSTDYGATWGADRLGNRNVRSVELIPKAYPTDYIRLVADAVSNGNDVLLRNTSLSDHTQWTAVTLSPAPANIYLIRRRRSNGNIFLATSNGVWKSTNDSSFTRVGLVDIDVISMAVASTGENIFAGTSTTLYKSTNSGSTWTNVGDVDASSVEAVQDGSNQVVWAVSKENAFAPKYTGSSWTNNYIGGVGDKFSSEHVYRNPHNGRIFAAGVLGGTASLKYSTNNGSDFSAAATPTIASGSYYYGCIAHPTLTGTMYLFGGGTVSGNWRNFFTSANGGADWSQPIGPIASSNIYVRDMIAISGTQTTLYAALSNGDVHKSVDGGATWNFSVDVGSIGRTVIVNLADASVVYAGGDGGLYKTTNSGTSWSQVRSDNVIRAIMHPSWQTSTNHIWVIGGGGNNIYKTTNGGTNWSDITGVISGKTVRDLRGDPVNKGFIYAATSDGVFQTNETPLVPANFGWTIPGGHPNLTWAANSEADVVSYDVTRYYQTCQTYCPNKTCGAAFGTETFNASNNYYNDNSITVFLCPAQGMGTPQIVTYHVKAVDNSGLRSAPTTIVTFQMDVGEPEIPNPGIGDREVPISTFLAENYPNPFNPETTISYGLAEDAQVKITLIDVLGREVKVLANEELKAGYYSVKFNAVEYASGVYLYKLTAGSFTDVKKMIVAK